MRGQFVSERKQTASDVSLFAINRSETEIIMANIIYDARKIKLMEAVKELSDLVGNSDEWFNSFWSLVMENENIYDELLYYIDHHDLLCRYTIENYSIVDLFVWQMANYNLLHDVGKNDASCSKEAMVLFAFEAMAKMAKEPEIYKKRIQSDMRLDK